MQYMYIASDFGGSNVSAMRRTAKIDRPRLAGCERLAEKGTSPHISHTAALFVVLVGCINLLTTAALTENVRARRGFDLFAWF